MSTPITFTAPSYAILNIDQNAVLTTRWGNLAIFSTRAVAEQVLRQTPGNLRIITVIITPITEQ